MRMNAKIGGLALVGGVGLGAALMYLLDPDRGRRRRHLMRDQLVHAGRVAGHSLQTSSHDLRNRARGVAAAARSRVTPDHADDVVIVERVRSALGRAVSHPGALTVTADQGRVTLGGPVLAGEVDALLGAVRAVRGVRDVENRLEV